MDDVQGEDFLLNSLKVLKAKREIVGMDDPTLNYNKISLPRYLEVL